MNNCLKVNFKAFAFFFKISPKYWIVYIINQVINVFYTYFDLYLFAVLINQFVGQINISKIIKIIVFKIVIYFVLNVIKKFMDYLTAVYYKEFINKENTYFVKKFMNVEYTDLERTEFRQLRRIIEETAYAGYGKIAFVEKTKELFYNVFSVIVSSYLFINLFISLVNNGIGFVSVLLFFLMFIFI